jgi:GNAT superfamily N-acetyltransferase
LSAGGTSYAIAPLAKPHDRAGFDCGVAKIDNYLTITALQEQKKNLMRVFVATEPESVRVVGFYTLTFIVWTPEQVEGDARHKFVKSGAAMPTIYLPKIGVRQTDAGKGCGRLLMRDAFQRSVAIADHAAISTLTLEAIDEEKAGWYESLGFQRFADGDLRMAISRKTLRQMSR